MSALTPSVDFGGARGSNTGDQFHELWALQQVLELLRPETELKAVGVEGVRTETPSENDNGHTWDGVDCTLYYGESTLENANRIEFAQLKYSASNPEKTWSVARLTANTAKKGNNSVIRKMADDFKSAKGRMKQGAQLKIRLISNQDISAGLRKALDAQESGPLESAGFEKRTKNDELQQLKAATSLTETDFHHFLQTLDFSECGSHSRFAIREKVVATVAGLLGDDILPEVRNLQVEIRQLMLPERAGEIVTDKNVLLWFGLSSREGLFPCPPDIRIPENALERLAADEVVSLLKNGERLVLVHGGGGCGKTTLMRQISDRLPKESVTVFFDCWGGGRCVYSDDKRHLPENAFLHLTNELAIALRLPLFVPRSRNNPATIQTFLVKLRLAGKALKQLSTEGILLVIIDAADNAVAAANNTDPPERPFVHDIFTANLSALPENVRIVTSCRADPSRRASLQLPSNTPCVICPVFTKHETNLHLVTVFSNPSDSFVEQFHHLSNANPRVQAYAIAASKGDQSKLLESLLPRGKSLPDVLKSSFDNALKKLGQPKIFDKLVGALAFLPSPIALSSLARLTGCAQDAAHDFTLDLAPGLRLYANEVTIADEDFDAFIKEKGSANRAAIIAEIAEDFSSTFKSDPYSSIHVADALINASRAREVLRVIEQDPQVSAIEDPIVRRQVQVRRLKLSLVACRDVGSTTDALRTVLISAEAERDDSILNGVLEKELDLSVEFGSSSLRRTILLNPDRIKDHGSFLAQDAVRAIRRGDRVTAREQLYFHDAWLRHRSKIAKGDFDDWTITDRDVAARVETILELAGPKVAFNELRRWKPRDLSIRVGHLLLPHLIAAGKSHYIFAFLKEYPLPGPWDLLLWVPLAMAGESVDGVSIEEALRRIRPRFIPDPIAFWPAYGEDRWQAKLLDTFITACELAFKLGLDSKTILGAVSQIQKVLEGKQERRLNGSEGYRIDGLFRCWLLNEEISERVPKKSDFIMYVKALHPMPKEKKRPGRKKQPKKRSGNYQVDSKEKDEELNKKIDALFPVYLARLEILSCVKKNQQITDEELNKLGSVDVHAYEFDHDHDSSHLRVTAAQSVMSLLIAENIEAAKLIKRASTLAEGRFSDVFARHRQNLWARMLLRTSESESLVLMIATAAEDIKGLRAASSEKLDAIIHLSRLLLPVSRDDSKSLFNTAVDMAKEIDLEAVDQIAFVSVLAERARIPQHSHIEEIAADIFAFVSGAAERLSNRDDFPWRSAIHALTCVDDAAALASISRWADDGTVRLGRTLHRFLLTALQRNSISPEAATSLAILTGGSDGDLRKELVSRAAAEPQKYNGIIEELAKEILLLAPQHERLRFGQEIIDRISPTHCSDGPWLEQIRDTITFLKKETINEPDKVTTIYQDKSPRLVPDNDLPKEFEFDPQGRTFTTPESITEVLQEAETSNLRHHDRDLLKMMRDLSSSPKDRVPFLNALAKVSEESISSTVRLETICETLAAWKGTPAVDRWCKETLPSIMVAQFHGVVRWLKDEQSILYQFLDYTESNADGRLQIILDGVAQVGESLDSRALFGIAEEIARSIEAEEAGTLLLWYARRLRNRLPAEDQSFFSLSSIPKNKTDTIARFLFALMSDIDTRVRWKAAHALRRLAKLGCFDLVEATVNQSGRVKDDVFRDPTGPFYFLAAKLWLTISLYRISAEVPEALSSCKAQIFDLAVSPELPHVGIREYAKRTLFQLAAAGVISLTASEKSQVDQINTALKGPATEKRNTHQEFSHAGDDQRRFKFDGMDTIPYWYNRILHIFPRVSQNQVLEMAEQWILDKWGAYPESNWWAKEPRKGRYDERRFGLWSHSHGSLPTIERYGTHLEWHAMHCVVGELLTTHSISNEDEDDIDSFEYWLERFLPTDPPEWLSDNRGPTPLEARLWNEDLRTDRGWLHNVRRDEFLTEIGLRSSLRKGWIVVGGSIHAHFPKREENIRINSALVSPETAPALVRALQTTSNPWNFRIPDEDDELQVDVPPYRLFGWLANIGGDTRFDEMDPFRYEVNQIQSKPGRELVEMLRLVPQIDDHRLWVCTDTGETALLYEAWCDEPTPERDSYSQNIRSDGWRLWAKSDLVRTFIANGGWNLIFEVQVERCLRNQYGHSYDADTKNKTQEKILLLRADGSVADAKGRIGSWTGVSRGVGSRSRRRHLEPLDGSPPRGPD